MTRRISREQHKQDMAARRAQRDARVSSFQLYAAPNRRLKPEERRGATVPSHKRVPKMETPRPLPTLEAADLDRVGRMAASLIGGPLFA